MTAIRRKKKDESFAFTFEGRKYVIQRAYKAQPATIVLSDGKILQVRVWKLLPVEPQPHQIETFDPAMVSAAELAQEKEGFLAELVER